MAITATFSPSAQVLSEFGDQVDNAIVTSRDAAGQIVVNGGAVPIQGGTATVASTAQIQVFGQGGNDTISLDESNGARVRFFRDVANITMDLNGVERIDFHALGGADNIVINDLSGTDLLPGGVLVDLAGTLGGTAGDGALDTVTVNGTAGDDAIKLFSFNGDQFNGGIGIIGTPAGIVITPSGCHRPADRQRRRRQRHDRCVGSGRRRDGADHQRRCWQ